MTLETIIFFNLGIYLIGCVGLLCLNNTVFKENAGDLSVFINILGIIFSLTLQLNSIEDWQASYKWIALGDITINYNILLNNYTTFMHVLVQVIAVFVQLFSLKYMQYDDGYNRYFAFLNLFIFSILGLVVAGNLLQLYIFWELVGFCSYLLIGFWYEKKSANEASIKAFLINRIGDAFILVGIFIIYNVYNSLDFLVLKQNIIVNNQILGLPFLTTENLKTTGILCVFVGIISKSAQIPLQIWLPDAMVGPTPASALIHAATMVVVGVFLLARLSYIITPDAGFVIAIIGAVTSVLAGYSAIFQYDIKKVLAYSTISQIGFMITGMGIGAVGSSLFHLTTHAFFKAGLFLCAGVVINHFRHEQDMRKMGNLTRVIPITYYVYLICGAALMGLPFTSGYLSKEALLTSAINYGYTIGPISVKIIIPVLLGFSSFFTTLYIVRQAVMVFFERQESPVDKIIDGTKKTFEGAYKTFQDLLTANNEPSTGENGFIKFFQNLGPVDISIIALAFSSTYFLFSKTPLDFSNVWFLRNQVYETVHYEWLPWTVGGVTLLGILISYNVTLDELRNYYFKTKVKGLKHGIFKLGFYHFYYDRFITKRVQNLIIGKPIANMNTFNTNKKEVVFMYKNGLRSYFSGFEINVLEKSLSFIVNGFLKLADWIHKFEINVLDVSVMKLSSGIKSAGNIIRKLQNGKIQLYILSMVLLVIAIFMFKIIFS